jgi:antitoxin (DNA-binding transcriptional repressor) of toxin-antitoxin stability system
MVFLPIATKSSVMTCAMCCDASVGSKLTKVVWRYLVIISSLLSKKFRIVPVRSRSSSASLDQSPWSSYLPTMLIHVNTSEAKSGFSELCAAALRGEDVIVQNAGVPKLRLVPLPDAKDVDRLERRKRVDAILARFDALPLKSDWVGPLQRDENGLPI